MCENLNLGGKEYPTCSKKGRKAKWIGHVMRWNCLLIHTIERKKERRKIRSDQSYVTGYIHV